jgi:signal peptidase II
MRSRTVPLLGAALGCLTLGGDQLLKSRTQAWVAAHGDIHAFPGLDIIATSNTGVAFSVAQGAPPILLVAIGLALSTLFLVWLIRARTFLHAIALGLAIGGALGNVVDRLRFGSVRDFIDLYWRGYHWPAFNLADAAVVAGLAILIVFPDRWSGEKPMAVKAGNRGRSAARRK